MKLRPRSEPADAPEELRVWQVAIQIGFILLAVGFVYWPALHGDFVWDDELLITANPLLRSLSGLREIWSFGRTADYFPLTSTVFWIEWQTFDRAAAGYHAINMSLQAADALLLWLVLGRLRLPGAWLAGLIFAIHPVHAESIAWISELKNLLSMFCLLVSFLCFIETDDRRGLGPTTVYLASVFFFLLALLAKTQVVFLPVVLLLYEWWRQGNHATAVPRNVLREKFIAMWPFFLIAIVLGLVTIWFQNRGIGEEEIMLGGFGRRLANAGLAVWWYAAHLFAPFRLMPIYPKWRFDSPQWFEFLPLLSLIAILAILWRWRNAAARAAFFAVAGFVVALAPVLGFLQMSYLRSGTLVADHYQYFADAFLIALFSAGVALLWARWKRGPKIALGALVLLLLVGMGSYTRSRSEVYRNEQTLWQDNLAKNPDAWQAHNRLGQYFFDRESYTEAAPHFERAVELKPELAGNHNQLGLVYCRLGRFEQGIAEYRTALEMKTARVSTTQSVSVATVRANLANALTITANEMSEGAEASGERGSKKEEAMRRYEEAIREYKKALDLEPRQPGIHRNLGILLARLGRYPEAVKHLHTVLELVPDEPNAREILDAIQRDKR
jgi:protein O-mannosyl-transferase